MSVLTLLKCLNVAYRQTKDRGGFGDFSVLKSPHGPSKAQVSCNSDELWGSEWIMPCFCTSLGWNRPGQPGRGLQRLCSTVPLGHGDWILPSAEVLSCSPLSAS